MKKVGIESECPYSKVHGYHVWFCFAHDLRWTHLVCTCVRCGAKSSGSSMRYDVIRHEIDRAWAERDKR